MEATILDLRYRMKDVLKALGRRESVKILYHGKLKGTIIPSQGDARKKVCDHPLFGIEHGAADSTVEQHIENLRKPRYHDL